MTILDQIVAGRMMARHTEVILSDLDSALEEKLHPAFADAVQSLSKIADMQISPKQMRVEFSDHEYFTLRIAHQSSKSAIATVQLTSRGYPVQKAEVQIDPRAPDADLIEAVFWRSRDVFVRLMDTWNRAEFGTTPQRERAPN